VGAKLRAKTVYTEAMVMFDAMDASHVASIALGEDFRAGFGNPYAVIHRADGVTLLDAKGRRHEGQAVMACDCVRSALRQQYVGDSIRVSGHVVFQAVIDTAQLPEALRRTAPCIWVGPNCHLVHYPLKDGDKYNLAVTFHSDKAEEWGVMDGDAAEVQRYFASTCEQLQAILRIPEAWKRWSTADRDPIETWVFGRAALLGDAPRGRGLGPHTGAVAALAGCMNRACGAVGT
jgi:salicylate hydroxylase